MIFHEYPGCARNMAEAFLEALEGFIHGFMALARSLGWLIALITIPLWYLPIYLWAIHEYPYYQARQKKAAEERKNPPPPITPSGKE